MEISRSKRTKEMFSNDRLHLGRFCKIPARITTTIIGIADLGISCLAIIAMIIGYHISSNNNQEKEDAHSEPVFWTRLAIFIVKAILGSMLVIATTTGRERGMKKLSYLWIPGNAVLLVVYCIIDWIALKSYAGGIFVTVVSEVAITALFAFCSLVVWAFIKTDYRNSSVDPERSQPIGGGGPTGE